MEWLESQQIKIDPPKRTKKITGTRFATILGLNPWSTAFEMWCAITKTYEVPFEDTIYTIAGKTIEPLQAEYMKKSYGMEIASPSDIWGKDYFNKTYGDFFKENKHLGGMWDYLSMDEDGNTDAVLEMKTTKRAEDWENDVPEYYALQAALYAYLLGVDDVIMVASFLEEKDYEDPSKYKPCAANTITVEFKVSERYPNFAELVAQVEQWWADYVDTGISPVYDEKKDAEILKALRTNTLSPETDVEALIAEAEGLKSEIDAVSATVADKEKRLKKLNDLLKEHAMKQFRDGDKKVDIKGVKYTWSLARTTKEVTKVNEDALKTDGLHEKYTTTSEETSYRMTVKEVK
ncbi:YqaJ viral recombinase family protein [Lachnospiraceae bacterium OttesenSCG-928-D06]|nr:YqaJ viral recombinase family protein [Lachnospiraceae bacterium OttesenSCG-928-D06]